MTDNGTIGLSFYERDIINGDPFTRRLLKDANGAVVKDHWDYKGKV